MTLLLDEHFSPALAEQLRLRGHDVVAAAELAHLRQRPDAEVLAWSAVEGRAVVSENVDDFLRLHSEYLARGQEHAGLILTTRRRFPRSAGALGRLVLALDELLQVLDDDDLRSATYWL